MAIQKGAVSYVGKIGNIRHFKISGKKGYFAGLAGGPTKQQIMTGPQFKRTRENMSEFGGVALAGKAIRQPLLSTSGNWDDGVAGRLVAALKKINLLDTAAPRGQRSIQITQYGSPLEAFEFNLKSHFGMQFKAPYRVTVDAGRAGAQFNTDVLDAPSTIFAPTGATHFRIGLAVEVMSDCFYNATDQKYAPSGGGANLNGLAAVVWSDYQDVANAALPALTLHATLPQTGTPPAPPTLTPDVSLLVCLAFELYQLVGGKYYLLEQGNSMKIETIATH